MLPTPSTSHVNYDQVYEPAEDSFLLLDTLSSQNERSFLRNRFPPKSPAPLVVEVGVGSGVVLGFMNAQAKEIMGRSDIIAMGTDVNASACKSARATVLEAIKEGTRGTGVLCDILLANLADVFRQQSIDILIFNPPYVPSEESPSELRHKSDMMAMDSSRKLSFERDSLLLSLSYAGGIDGMETTNVLLNDLTQVLHPTRGVAYVLLCAQNKPAEVMDMIRRWGSEWNVVVAGHSGKRGGWEVLQILRIWRDCSSTNASEI